MNWATKICTLLFVSTWILTGCDKIVAPDSNSDCQYIGLDGLIHYYNCNQGGDAGGNGYLNDIKHITISVNLPDTAFNKNYGVFFITDIFTKNVGDESQGWCPNDTNFTVTCINIFLDSFYIAVLVSQNQKYPVKFKPESGDYLGWYNGNGIYPGEKCIYDSTIYCTINLDKIP